jgi:arylsulfatase A-like enzyme
MSRPNILVFMTDDHGPWAARCCGQPELHTPSLDYIAARGVRMERAFTPSPVCSPARASFWTGRIPSGHGVHDYIYRDAQQHPGIAGQRTLAMRLHDAGYRTGLSGKWHCDPRWVPQPGFDDWHSMAYRTDARFGSQSFNDNGVIIDTHGHQAPFVTQGALRFLSNQDDRPFFLFVGYTDTHSPFSGKPPRLFEHYRRHCTFDAVPDEPFAACHGTPKVLRDTANRRDALAAYFAAVSMIDEQVGRILDELDTRGILDNTLIVYTADHGHNNGHHGIWCKGNATTPQNMLDESVMVPSLLCWPGRIVPGSVRSQPVDHCDLHATLLDAADVAHDEEFIRWSPGRSFLPLIGGADQPWRDWQVCEYGNARMVRTPTGKLIRRFAGPNGRFADQFHDLAEDPRETRNVIGDPRYAGDIAQMDARMADWFARYADPARSGDNIASQPWCNNDQPWSRPPAGQRAES